MKKLLIVLSLIPQLAYAQTTGEVDDRIDRLQRDIMMLQRQVARGESAPAAESDLNSPFPRGAGSPQTEVQISNMQQEMRELRGKLEENNFQLRKLQASFERFQKDTEFRLNSSAQTPGPAPIEPAITTTSPKAKPAAAADVVDMDPIDTGTEAHLGMDDDTAPHATTAGDGMLRTPDETGGDTPRDKYNHAFRLLNQTRYNESAKAFMAFIDQHPKDPLIGNAYYWLGETYYIKRDYVKAADYFRQGFEALPTGPKAADNLLKLSMSLSATQKTEDACIVLKQLVTKYKDSSAAVVQKAQVERARNNCK